jgi:hypothetical protein
MRACLPKQRISYPKTLPKVPAEHKSARHILKPLWDLAENSDNLVGGTAGDFALRGEVIPIPRFIFLGPTGGGDTFRLAIFAGLNGETEGTEALVAFLQGLENSPQIARGFHIYAYPIGNPSEFAQPTTYANPRQDLSADFWKGSTRPEVYYLEREIGVLQFHGVIALKANDHRHEFAATTGSDILNQSLAWPAVAKAQQFLRAQQIPETEPPRAGLREAHADFLTATDELKTTPFELHIGIPRRVPLSHRIQGTVQALNSILDSYRNLQSLRQNI